MGKDGLNFSRRFPALDGVRGLAALCVLMYHVGITTGYNLDGWLGPLTARLNLGVSLFFALSGFLLYRPFVIARSTSTASTSSWRYYRRRAIRVFPAYWVALAAIALIPGIIEQNDALAPLDSGQVWRYALLTSVYTANTAPLGLSQAWTLCVELTFYLLLPLWALVAARAPRIAWELGGLLLLACASIGVRILTYSAGDAYISLTIAGTFAWFAVGMALARVSVAVEQKPAWIPRVEVWWSLAAGVYAVGVWGGLPRLADGQPSTGQWLAEYLLNMLITFLILAPICLGRPLGSIDGWLAWRPLRYLGRVSYGIYLWHLVVLAYIHAHRFDSPWFNGPFGLSVALTFLGAVVFATASWYLVERPSVRLERCWAHHPTTASGDPSAAPGTVAAEAHS